MKGKSINLERALLDRLGNRLGFKTLEDWYKISFKDIQSIGSSKLLSKYGNPIHLVESIFTEQTWLPWKFECWKGDLKEHQFLSFVNYLEQKLWVKNKEDWHRVSWSQISQISGTEFLNQNRLQEYFCSKCIRTHSWNFHDRKGIMKASQRVLKAISKKSFQMKVTLHNTHYFTIFF